MRKAKSVIGKPVLTLEDGTRLHEVKDVILGPGNDTIAGLLIDEGGLFGSSLVVPAEEIESFGRDAVVVRSRGSIVAANDAPVIKEILDQEQKLLGTEVFTETGDDQGKVADVYFDEASHRVVGLEVTGGTIANITSGARFLPVDEVLRTGPDVLFVRPETAEDLQQQRGGISGALADAGDRARESASTAGDKMKSAASQGAERARSSAQQATNGTDPAASLVGKRVGRDVDDSSGSVIVPAGRRVTEDDVERARSAGKLSDLATAAGLGEMQFAGEGAKDTLGEAGDTAANLWDKFTHKLGEIADQNGQRIDEEQTKRRLNQIEDAVGRPVTKVILDLDDQVILDLGDVITHVAVQRSYEAGSLDTLLDSVYKGEVSFSKEEMRAQRPGIANLEQAQATDERPEIVEKLRDKVETSQREREQRAAEKKAQDESTRQAKERERQSRRQQRQTAERERETSGSSEEPVLVGSGAGSNPTSTSSEIIRTDS